MPDHVIRSFLNDFRAVGPGVHNRITAARAGISVAVPLLTLVAVDRPEWSAFCAFGALVSDLLEWKPPGGVFTLFAFSLCTVTGSSQLRV